MSARRIRHTRSKKMNTESRFELLDWLSTLSGVVFLVIRMVDVSPALFIIGSSFCILEGIIDSFLYFKTEKKKHKTMRMIISAIIILASIGDIFLLYMKSAQII